MNKTQRKACGRGLSEGGAGAEGTDRHQERIGGVEEKCCIHNEIGPEHDLFPCNGT